MSETILFENNHLLRPVALIGGGLWLIFIWKEWKNPLSRRFFLHILIAFIGILSFAMIALKPTKNNSNQMSAVVLLTDGYHQKSLDSIKAMIKGIKAISYTENVPLSETLDSLGSIYVLGNGVAPFDLWQFENRPVVYLGADVPTGIIRLKYPTENILGADLTISGKYNKTIANHRLVLQDANGLGVDSVWLASDSDEFSLKTPLKATGKFVFKIIEKDTLGEEVSSEPLPFKVVDRKGLKVLLINRFPTFETKYLKNYLGEMGHEVVVRSQLTKSRYKFEYFNTSKTPIYNLNETTLANFDLLIIDATSFKNSSQSVKRSMENVVRNDGLGMFIQPEFNLFNLPSGRLGLKFKKDGKLKVALNEFPKATLEKFPFELDKSNNLEPIHANKKAIFTAYRRLEKGRIGATVFQNTYQLQLKGKKEAYKKFWSRIISKLAKRNELLVKWETTEDFPLENQPYMFELHSRIEEPQVQTREGYPIGLRQDVDIPSVWSGTTYPLEQKWNQLLVVDAIDDTHDFYVIDSLNWQSLRATNLQNKNRRFFSNPSEVKKKKMATTAIHPFWFFSIGLLSLGYLWLHPKLYSNAV